MLFHIRRRADAENKVAAGMNPAARAMLTYEREPGGVPEGGPIKVRAAAPQALLTLRYKVWLS